MRNTGADFDSLADDLDAAVAELIAAIGQDPSRWERGTRGRWTVGQHAAHVAITLRRTADDFEAAERSLRAGTLPPVPARRSLLNQVFLGLVAGRGYMPRGLRTAGLGGGARAPRAPGHARRPASGCRASSHPGRAARGRRAGSALDRQSVQAPVVLPPAGDGARARGARETPREAGRRDRGRRLSFGQTFFFSRSRCSRRSCARPLR